MKVGIHHKKQTRDFPRLKKARVLVSLGKSKNGSNVVPRTWHLLLSDYSFCRNWWGNVSEKFVQASLR